MTTATLTAPESKTTPPVYGPAFGTHRRLASVLESAIFDFLGVSNLGALCLTSHSFLSAVRASLSSRKALHITFDELEHTVRNEPFELLGLRVAGELCSSLTHVNIPERWCRDRDDGFRARVHQFAAQLLTHNRAALRAQLFELLLACPKLETVQIDHDNVDEKCFSSPEVAKRIASCWPSVTDFSSLRSDGLQTPEQLHLMTAGKLLFVLSRIVSQDGRCAACV